MSSRKIIKKTLKGELYHQIEKLGNKNYTHIGFRDDDNEFGDALAFFVPEVGMTKKAKITIEIYE